MNPEPTKKIKLFDYAVAWVEYISALLHEAANISRSVRAGFDALHIPEKEDFYE